MTTLTKALLLDKAQPRRTERVDVEGFGVVIIKARNEYLRSKRLSEGYDDNGNQIPEKAAMNRIYYIIDQVCNEDGTSMFSPADISSLKECSGEALDPLVRAIVNFNENETDEGNEEGELED